MYDIECLYDLPGSQSHGVLGTAKDGDPGWHQAYDGSVEGTTLLTNSAFCHSDCLFFRRVSASCN